MSWIARPGQPTDSVCSTSSESFPTLVDTPLHINRLTDTRTTTRYASPLSGLTRPKTPLAYCSGYAYSNNDIVKPLRENSKQNPVSNSRKTKRLKANITTSPPLQRLYILRKLFVCPCLAVSFRNRTNGDVGLLLLITHLNWQFIYSSDCFHLSFCLLCSSAFVTRAPFSTTGSNVSY